MPRKLQTSFPKGRGKTMAALGDSLTFNGLYSTMGCEFYPEQLAEMLRAPALNCGVQVKNFGYAGDNTTGALRRIRVMTRGNADPLANYFENPEIAILMIGVNDPGDGRTATTLTRAGTVATFTAASAHGLSTGDVVAVSGSNLSPYNVGNAVVTVTSATVFTYVMASDPGGTSAGTPRFDHQTQGNIEAMIMALRNNVVATIGSQTLLPAGKPAGLRYLVRYDTSTTGGVTTSGSGVTPATLTGTQAGTRIWIARNGLAGESGWSRITPDNTGVQRIIVMSAQWLHFANGLGDTVATDYAAYAPVRTKQAAAATAQGAPSANVTFFDLHAYQEALIVAGYEGELTGTWAALANDQHPSAYAGLTWARGLLAHIQAQTGWMAALT